MKNVSLKAVGIELDVPDNIHYQYDGEVKSLVLHTAQLARQYSRQNPEGFSIELLGSAHPAVHKEGELPHSFGRCVHVFDDDKSLEESLREEHQVYFHTFVLSGRDEKETMFYRGHEETHFLHAIQRLDALQMALSNRNIRSESLPQLPVEAICQVGGFYAFINSLQGKEFHLKNCIDKEFQTWTEWLSQNSTWQLRMV